MKLEYIKKGDFYIPNIELSNDNKKINLGKYGRLREKYLIEHKPGLFEYLKMSESLISHLENIENNAKSYEETLIKQLAEKENINENLKINNQIEWIQKMNLIRLQAEEMVCKEIIYK